MKSEFMKKPKISVIVPCYNYGHFIAQTLQCLQKQTFKDWECIVVDDGSTDNSKSVVAHFVKEDPRITYIYQDNKGLPGARNTGIDVAKGMFVQFLDADDLLEVSKLEEQYKAFEANPELDFIYSPVMYFMDGQEDKLRHSSSMLNFPWTLTKSGKGKSLLRYLIISSVIMVHMPIVRRKSVIEIGKFTTHLRSCEDWEFWLRCCSNDLNFKYVDAKNTRSLIRLHPSSMTRNRTVMLTSMIEVRELIFDMVKEDKQLTKLNHKFIINDWIELALVQQKHESKEVGTQYIEEKRKTVFSLRLMIFPIFMKLFPVSLNLFILSIIRSVMKKWYYS